MSRTRTRRPRRPRRVPGIETRWRGGRWTHRVRWTDPVTGQRRSEEFDALADAIDFREALRRARRHGRMQDLTAGREVLREFVAGEWWPTHATVNLERATLIAYSSVWSKHLDPRVGHLQLREIDPGVVAKLRLAMEQDGVGAPTIVKAMTMLQSIFATAVIWGRAQTNPVAMVRKPTVTARVVEPLSPLAVERIAAQPVLDLTGRMLIYVVSYAGLRPEEALALRWRHVRRQTLLVEQKNVDGEILSYLKVRTKPPRSVDLLRPLLQDLAAYRLALGRPHDAAFVFARPDGGPWLAGDYRNWRRRRWQVACDAAGLGEIRITRLAGRARRTYEGPTPYWLRHSFASLLLHEGRLSPAELAEQLGHSIQTLLKTYSHVMADLKGQPRVPAEQQIAEARAKLAGATAATDGQV